MAILLDGINLPENLYWEDEYTWSPIEQTLDFSLTGALIVDEGSRQAGRSITLTTPDGGDWTTRSVIDTLYAKLGQSADMTLSLHDGRSFTVRWRQGETPIEAKPAALEGVADPDGATIYSLTLRLIEV